MFMKLLPLLQKLFVYLLPFLQKKVEEIVVKPVVANNAVAAEPAKVEAPQPSKPTEIDWNDPKSRINKRFSVKEATYLPSWGVSHIPNAEQKKNIIDIATKVDLLMDKLEVELGKKLVVDVHVFVRPGIASVPGTKFDGLDYNSFLYTTIIWAKLTPEEKSKKKVPNSPHKTGCAIDFHILGYEGAAGNDKMRAIILPHLEEFGVRMEDNPGSTWTHLDCNPVISHRFFKP